jgi:hypothetical protein
LVFGELDESPFFEVKVEMADEVEREREILALGDYEFASAGLLDGSEGFF